MCKLAERFMRPSTRTIHLPHIFIFIFFSLKFTSCLSLQPTYVSDFRRRCCHEILIFMLKLLQSFISWDLCTSFKLKTSTRNDSEGRKKSIWRTSELVYSSEIETIRCRERFKLFSNRKIYSLSAKSANMLFYPVVDSTVDLRRIFERFSFLWEIQHNGW